MVINLNRVRARIQKVLRMMMQAIRKKVGIERKIRLESKSTLHLLH